MNNTIIEKLISTIKKHKYVLIFCVFILVVVLSIFVSDKMTKSDPTYDSNVTIYSEQSNYTLGGFGSFRLDERLYETGNNDVPVGLYLNTWEARNANYDNNDALIVVSNSYNSNYYSIENIIYHLNSLKNNESKKRVALVTYNDNYKVISDFTTDYESLINALYEIEFEGNCNYEKALDGIDAVLSNYQQDGRQLDTLITIDELSSGNEQVEKNKYNSLKEKYPYLKIFSSGIEPKTYSRVDSITDGYSSIYYILKQFRFDNFNITVDYNSDNFEYVSDYNNVFNTSVDYIIEDSKIKINLYSFYTGQNLDVRILFDYKNNSNDIYVPMVYKTTMNSSLQGTQNENIVNSTILYFKSQSLIKYNFDNMPSDCRFTKTFENKYYPIGTLVEIPQDGIVCDNHYFHGFSDYSEITVGSYDNTFSPRFTKLAIQKNFATADFDSGVSVKGKINALVGLNTSYSTSNNIVEKFLRSYDLPDGFEPSTENTVSTSYSDKPIYIWYDSNEKAIYYYADTDVVYLNRSCSHMFDGFSKLADLSGLQYVNTSKVTNMSNMLSYTAITNVDFAYNWDVSNVSDFLYFLSSARSLSDISGLSNWNTKSASNIIGFLSETAVSDLTPLSNWNTSNVTNMDSTFYAMSGLTNLNGLENWDVSKVTDMDLLFWGNTSLTNISALRYWNTNSLQNMTYIFSNCDLRDLTPLSNWNVSKVNSFEYSFYDNANLTSLNGLDNWDTSSVTNMRFAFYKDTSISDISGVRNWNTSKVTDFAFMFAIRTSPCVYPSYTSGLAYFMNGNQSITNISALLNWDVSKITNMEGAFYDTKIQSLDGLQNWDVSNVTSLSDTFSNTDYLTDISALLNWDVSKVISVYNSFAYDHNLETLHGLENWNTSNFGSISSLFYGDKKLTDISALANWDVSKQQNISYLFSSCDLRDLTPLSNWDVSNVTNMNALFRDNNNLTNLNGLENWNLSKVESVEQMFQETAVNDLTPIANWDISKITTFNSMLASSNVSDIKPIKNWNFESANNLSRMFYGINITNLEGIESWNLSNVTNISYIFENCENLTNIEALSSWDVTNIKGMSILFKGTGITDLTPIQNWNVSSVTSMYQMFSNTSLTDLTPLANWNVSSVTEMTNILKNNTSIETLHGLENWRPSSLTSMYGMFDGASSLNDISALLNWNAQPTSLENTFNSTGLVNLHGLENLDVSKVTSMKNTFKDNTLLSDITALSNWNTNKVKNMTRMFMGCSSLNDASSINNWDLSSLSKTTSSESGGYYMFNGVPTHPEFVNRSGSWNSQGSFFPN